MNSNYPKQYTSSYSQSLSQHPRVTPVTIRSHNLGSNESKYWNNRKDDPNDNSPHSSHSINTPIKLTSGSTTLNRPNSKDLYSNKVESSSSYSKFSGRFNDNLNMNVPLEKSVSIENNSSIGVGRALNQNYGLKPLKNDIEEEKYNPYNFKKKDDYIYSGSQENSIYKKASTENLPKKESNYLGPQENSVLKKTTSESIVRKESIGGKKCKFPYTPKMLCKREMAGLRNIGNTCFLNSTLQCIFNTPQFSDFFLEGEFASQINSKSEKGVAEEFAKLIKKVRSVKSNSAESTYGLKSSLSKFSSKFSGYDQEDAQEFLITLLSGLVNDLNKVKVKPKYKELDDNLKNKTMQTLSDEWYDYFRKFEDSIVNDYFEGQLLSELKCQNSSCRHISRSFDNFFDLSLSFTRGLKMVLECDLERLIEHFTKEEKMEEDSITCPKCKKTNFSKQMTFWRLPRILVIHLKRFNFGRFRRDKLDNAVKFPLKDLDLSKFVTESNDDSVKDCCLYDCFGIVNHSGSLYGGHYTSESMSPYDKKWYRYNDDYVSDIPNMDDKNYKNYGSSNAYLLFYAKKIIF